MAPTFTNRARPGTKRYDYIEIMIDMWARGVIGEAAIAEAAEKMAEKHSDFDIGESRGFYRFLVETQKGPGEYSRSIKTKRSVVIARDFNVVIERDEDGIYVASVPSLPGCHTQARSLDQLMERIREAIALHLEDGEDPSDQLEFVGVQRVTVAA